MKKVLLLALTMLLASKTSLAIVNNPDKYGNTSPTKTTAQVQDISLDGKWRFIADSTDYSQGLPANVQSLAGVWQAETGDHTLIVGISVKNSIPTYILRGYTLRYTDANGHPQSIALPTMHPGQRYDISVPDINARFKFDICRLDGGTCLSY